MLLLLVFLAFITILVFVMMRRGGKVKPAQVTTAPDGRLIRQLCKCEAQYVRWARDFSGAQKIGIVAGFDKQLRYEDVEKAVRKMERRHPFCRSVLNTDGVSLIEAKDWMETGVIQITEVKNADAETWKKVWDKRQTEPMLINREMFAVAIVRHDRGCELLLTGNHLVADADAIMQLQGEILESICDPDKFWEPLDYPPAISNLARLAVPSYMDRLKSWFNISKWLYRLVFTTSGLPWSVENFNTGFASPGIVGEPAVINSQEFKMIQEAAKSRGLRLNSLLMAALARTTADEIDQEYPSEIGMNVTVNLRSRFNATIENLKKLKSGGGCFAYSIYTSIVTGGKKDNFWEVSKSSQEHVENSLSPWIVFPPILLASLLWRSIPTDGAFGRSCVVVLGNWGRTPIEQDKLKGLGTIKFVRPLLNFQIFNLLYCAVTTTEGVLTITPMASSRVFTQNQINSFGARMKKVLLDGVKSR